MAMFFTTPEGRAVMLFTGLHVLVSVGPTTITGMIVEAGGMQVGDTAEAEEPGLAPALLDAWMRQLAPKGASYVVVDLEGSLPDAAIGSTVAIRVFPEDQAVPAPHSQWADRVPREVAVSTSLVGYARILTDGGRTRHVAVLAVPDP